MAVKRIEADYNVLEAARIRVINVFNTGLPIHLSVSGGKDSICLADVILQLIQEGKINPRQLTVQFIDEEAIFDDVEKIVLDLRRKFLLVGAKFEWYCIQVKHFNCLNNLDDDESFITWDMYKEDKWVRPMPKFAIKTHKLLRERKDTYQQFLPRINKGCIQLIGIRAAESVMRMNNIGKIMANKNNDGGMNGDNSIFPIYDWSDDDIWLHIKKRNLDFPNTYLNLYRVGEGRNKMRLSQFFSIDTARTLTKLEEHQPGLMKRIIRREPNAYLASLYWDSEMFRRNTAARKKNEKSEEKDYKKLTMELLSDIDNNVEGSEKQKIAKKYKKFILSNSKLMNNKTFRDCYNAIIAGDPKSRVLRSMYTRVHSDKRKMMKIEAKEVNV